MLTGKMGMQSILLITVPVKKIKGIDHQCYGDGDEVIRCVNRPSLAVVTIVKYLKL